MHRKGRKEKGGGGAAAASSIAEGGEGEGEGSTIMASGKVIMQIAVMVMMVVVCVFAPRVSADSKLLKAIDAEDLDAIRDILNSGEEHIDHPHKSKSGTKTAVFIAAEDDKIKALRMMLKEFKPDITKGDDRGFTALDTAGYFGLTEAVDSILEIAGPENNYFRDMKGADGNSWITRLVWGDEPKHAETLKLVLDKYEYDPNTTGAEGVTLLHSAAHYGSLLTMKALLAAGADVTKVDSEGNTALHYVARTGDLPQYIKITSALIKGGCDKFHRNRQGLSAFDIAELGSNQRKEVIHPKVKALLKTK